MVPEGSVDGSAFDFAAYRTRPDQPSLGVLCIHGFTATPFQMRYLGRSLAGRGMRVMGPVLPGHGTSPDDLAQSSWRDWYGAVETALDALMAECERVAVVGLSLGGLLSLRLAQQRPADVSAVASLAAPLWLTGLATAVVNATRSPSGAGRILARMLRKLPKLNGSDIRDREMKRANPVYRTMPLPAIHQLVEFMNLVRADLPRITSPTLVIHARDDHTAPFACAHELVERVADAKLQVLETSYHHITIDAERDLVAASVGDFLDIHLRPGAARSDPERPGRTPT